MKAKTSSRRQFLTDLMKPPVATGPMTMRKGPHGEDVSVLGYGAMRLPTVDGGNAAVDWGGSSAAINFEELDAQIDYALEHGINYFDSAPPYCRGESEGALGKSLARHPRERYFIATKMSNLSPETFPLEKSKEIYRRSMKLFRTDRIDFYLLHNIGFGSYEVFLERFVKNGVIDFLLRERDAGRIRNLGFSVHGDPRCWEWMMDRADKYKWDFAQIQLNYVDWLHAKEVYDYNENAKALYDACVSHGMKVSVMEPLLGGRLARFSLALAEKLVPLDPTAPLATWALRFAGHHANVMTVLSGMTYRENLVQNCATCSPLKPLTEKELATLEEAAQAMLADHTIPCNSCNYCMPCPFGLDIPSIIEVHNRALSNRRLPDDPKNPQFAAWREEYLDDYRRSIPNPLRRADHCTGCGKCRPHCPQSIDIPSEIQRIDRFVEGLS